MLSSFLRAEITLLAVGILLKGFNRKLLALFLIINIGGYDVIIRQT